MNWTTVQPNAPTATLTNCSACFAATDPVQADLTPVVLNAKLNAKKKGTNFRLFYMYLLDFNNEGLPQDYVVLLFDFSLWRDPSGEPRNKGWSIHVGTNLPANLPSPLTRQAVYNAVRQKCADFLQLPNVDTDTLYLVTNDDQALSNGLADQLHQMVLDEIEAGTLIQVVDESIAVSVYPYYASRLGPDDWIHRIGVQFPP